MFKYLRKFGSNKSGFTLTEVMIGIMILTVAIVSASNLLVSLVNTNKNNVKVLQAYYLAQEGIEAVRNIRDTNWLLNFDFKGKNGVYDELKEGAYKVALVEEGWVNSTDEEVGEITGLNSKKPWDFERISDVEGVDNFSPEFALTKRVFTNSHYITGGDDVAEFYRHVKILPYSCKEIDTEEGCENFILVKSVVNWRDGSDENEISLDAVLSNWKGGTM